MDLIYTNRKGIEQGVLQSYSLDLSFGAAENNFELTVDKSEPILENGAYIHIEGTEYGGIVGGQKYDSELRTRTTTGRTWHGVLNSKVLEPNAGADYLIVSGDSVTVLTALISRLGLSKLFTAAKDHGSITVKRYQFARYCKGYDGIRAMLKASSAKLRMHWNDGKVHVWAEPLTDYTESPIDGDDAVIVMEKHHDRVNHLVCLGSGELQQRMVLHLYVDQFGRIGTTKYYTGLNEITDVYDFGNAGTEAELKAGGVTRLEELQDVDKVDVTAREGSSVLYDIGDIVGGTDSDTGNTASAEVTQKIVRINNGTVSIEYQTGG